MLFTIHRRILAVSGAAALLIPVTAFCQAPSGPSAPATGVLPQSAYLTGAAPQEVRSLLIRFGNRFQKPGNERLTLTGTWTDSDGSAPATVVSEITGNIRIQLSGSNSKTILSAGSQTTTNAGKASGADQDIVDSLMADSPQTFFYAWSKKAGIRYLGSRFRTDGGKDPAHKGPWYNIYEVVAPTADGSGKTQRRLYYIDTYTRQFGKTRYTLLRNGAPVEVQTVFSDWFQVNGQSVPRRIERFENGKSVFSFAIGSAATSPATADGIFPASPSTATEDSTKPATTP
jgi:hypothetical protein